jgi:chromate reductase, NAD(P)H dehydrogenase (quinone)
MSDAHSRPVRLLGLTGSLRRGSYSSAILLALAPALEGRCDFEIRDLRLPLYDQDEEDAGAPDVVRALRAAVSNADGLVICTPEYNHGMPGVLKNALDWGSRPSGQSAWKGKPTLVISNSPSFTGGVRAQAQVHETLLAAGASIAPGPQVVIGNMGDKVRDGRLVDAHALTFALQEVERLVRLCQNALN